MTTREYLALGYGDEDAPKKKEFNRALVERHPYLLPRNRFTGETPEDYDWTWTELDLMPKGWRLAFGDEMCDRITAALNGAGCIGEYRIADIKEKWGRLCWYDFGAPDEVMKIISEYQNRSETICIYCGDTAKWISRKGWILPYCDTCVGKKSNVNFEVFEEIK